MVGHFYKIDNVLDIGLEVETLCATKRKKKQHSRYDSQSPRPRKRPIDNSLPPIHNTILCKRPPVARQSGTALIAYHSQRHLTNRYIPVSRSQIRIRIISALRPRIQRRPQLQQMALIAIDRCGRILWTAGGDVSGRGRVAEGGDIGANGRDPIDGDGNDGIGAAGDGVGEGVAAGGGGVVGRGGDGAGRGGGGHGGESGGDDR